MLHENCEIACDESGYEGERLIGGETKLFAHGSVRMTTTEADELLAELRRRIGSPATEYKANHLQRSKHRAVLEWLLGPDAPLLGRSHVYLVDKALLVVRALLDTLVSPATTNHHTTVLAGTVHRDSSARYGTEPWREFLIAGNTLLRTNPRVDADAAAVAFYGKVAALRTRNRRTGNNGEAEDLLTEFAGSGDRLAAFRAALAADPALLPPLDPLMIGIVGTVRSWTQPGPPVAMVHDRQNVLSRNRIEQLVRLLGTGNDGTPGSLTGIAVIPSHSDARIQLADIVAGTVRGIIEGGPRGHPDAALRALARPFIDPASLWTAPPV